MTVLMDSKIARYVVSNILKMIFIAKKLGKVFNEK